MMCIFGAISMSINLNLNKIGPLNYGGEQLSRQCGFTHLFGETSDSYTKKNKQTFQPLNLRNLLERYMNICTSHEYKYRYENVRCRPIPLFVINRKTKINKSGEQVKPLNRLINYSRTGLAV